MLRNLPGDASAISPRHTAPGNNPDRAREQILNYYNTPARGPMAACIDVAQRQAASSLLANCASGAPSQGAPTCFSVELLRLTSNVLDDALDCMQMGNPRERDTDARRIVGKIWRESKFMPNAFGGGQWAGYGQYADVRVEGNYRNRESFDRLLARDTLSCRRLRTLFAHPPMRGSFCAQMAHPQFMASNLIASVIDFRNARDEGLGLIRDRMIQQGWTPEEARRVAAASRRTAQFFAWASHNRGSGAAENALDSFLDGRVQARCSPQSGPMSQGPTSSDRIPASRPQPPAPACDPARRLEEVLRRVATESTPQEVGGPQLRRYANHIETNTTVPGGSGGRGRDRNNEREPHPCFAQ